MTLSLYRGGDDFCLDGSLPPRPSTVETSRDRHGKISTSTEIRLETRKHRYLNDRNNHRYMRTFSPSDFFRSQLLRCMMFLCVPQVLRKIRQGRQSSISPVNSALLSTIRMHSPLHVPHFPAEVSGRYCFQWTQPVLSSTPRISIVVKVLRPVSGSYVYCYD